jgi:hypothetical protein
VLYHVVENAGFIDGSQANKGLSVVLTVASGIAILVSIGLRISWRNETPIVDRGLDRDERLVKWIP